MTTVSIPLEQRSRRVEHGLRAALVITRRDIVDAATDWRIVTPMFILAFLFPLVVAGAIALGVPYLERADPDEALAKVVPFGLMLCGFFPISFSLVIALETFVGEKERNTLEALLAMPLSDGQLFLGKLLAVLVPPFVLSLTAIGVFLASSAVTIRQPLEPAFVGLVILLSLAEAVVMVAGAVVVSSHTTSVRAANLLASFIILPMAVLVQIESLVVLAGLAAALWAFLAVLAVCATILVRMGVHAFNREEILAHESAELSPRLALLGIRRAFNRTPAEARRGLPPSGKLTLKRLYTVDIPQAIAEARPALIVVTVMCLVMAGLGYYLAQAQPFPGQVRELDGLARRDELLRELQAIGGPSIFLHNLRSLAIGAVLSVFSFGAGAPLLLLVTMTLVGFLMGQAAIGGYDPGLFFGVFILPHGVLEIPAALLSAAAAFRFGLAIMAPPAGWSFGASLLQAVVNWIKLLALIVPALFLAGLLEVNLTPQVVRAVFGD